MIDKNKLNNLCYACCMVSNWDLKNISKVKRENYESCKEIMEISNYELFVRAIYYAKKSDYIDKYLSIIRRKNGELIADKVFTKIFPNFHSIDDLYHYCYNAVYKKKNIDEVSLKIGINKTMITYYANEYKVGVFPYDNRHNDHKRKILLEKYPDYCGLIKALIENDKEEIEKYVIKLKKIIRTYRLVKMAAILYPKYDYSLLNKDVLSRYYIYYQNHLFKVSNELISDAEKSVRLLVDSCYPNLNFFYEYLNINKKDFLYHVDIVSIHNKKLYKEYQDKVSLMDNNITINVLRVKKVLSNIISNDNYSIINYFFDTNLELDYFYNIVKDNLNSNEYDKLSSFYLKYKDMKLINMKEFW